MDRKNGSLSSTTAMSGLAVVSEDCIIRINLPLLLQDRNRTLVHQTLVQCRRISSDWIGNRFTITL
jgi:hypothetical protein